MELQTTASFSALEVPGEYKSIWFKLHALPLDSSYTKYLLPDHI